MQPAWRDILLWPPNLSCDYFPKVSCSTINSDPLYTMTFQLGLLLHMGNTIIFILAQSVAVKYFKCFLVQDIHTNLIWW